MEVEGRGVRHAAHRPRGGDPLLHARPGRLPDRGRSGHGRAARPSRQKAPRGPPRLTTRAAKTVKSYLIGIKRACPRAAAAGFCRHNGTSCRLLPAQAPIVPAGNPLETGYLGTRVLVGAGETRSGAIRYA